MNGTPTASFWGKFRIEPADPQWHPLIDHCADVAACCEALLLNSSLRTRLARLGGLDDLSSAQISRLAVLAAFHDIGKFNLGFQRKAFPPYKGNGHVREVLALLGDTAWAEQTMLLRALPLESFYGWASEDIAIRLLVASISHHGKPIPVGGSHQKSAWEPSRGLDPFAGIETLSTKSMKWFAEAFAHADHPLPSEPAFQHGFSGLVMLADWIGSDTRFFPYSTDEDSDRMEFARTKAQFALQEIGLDVRAYRSAMGVQPAGFKAVSPFTPNGTQRLVDALPIDEHGGITLLEAETGSGKTEAALARFVRLFQGGAVDGMYFALPTRTAATQIFARVREAVKRAFPPTARPAVVLAVPGYIAVDDSIAQQLPEFNVLWNDDDNERMRYRGWAAESPKRYLAGAIVIGTVDQILLSTLMVSHAHLRATALLRHLLVVDEVHASDGYMTALLERVLQNHLSAGGHALLMSATLGSNARERLLAPANRATSTAKPLAIESETPYPLITHHPNGGERSRCSAQHSGYSKTVQVTLVPEIGELDRLANRAVQAAQQGARVIFLRNTVRDCIETQLAVELAVGASTDRSVLFAHNGSPAPHHSRFAKIDREALDAALETRLGKAAATGAGCIVVATQTVQQSLDIDADLLITDLCPMDVLLQRIGRLHRHAARIRPAGFGDARVEILTSADRDLTGLINAKGQARGKYGIGTVYDDLRIIEATWRVLARNECLMIPEMNRRMVEETTHPEALAAIVLELGERWQLHEQQVTGCLIADQRLAALNVIDRTEPFGDRLEFPSSGLERRIQTRLGEGDRLIDLPDDIVGPFGKPIRRLTLPTHMARGVPGDAVATEITEINGTLSFTFGTKRFIYDHLGLRPHSEPQSLEEDPDDA